MILVLEDGDGSLGIYELLTKYGDLFLQLLDLDEVVLRVDHFGLLTFQLPTIYVKDDYYFRVSFTLFTLST